MRARAVLLLTLFPLLSGPLEAQEPPADIILRQDRSAPSPAGGSPAEKGVVQGPLRGQPPLSTLREQKRLLPLLADSLGMLGETFSSTGTLHLPFADRESISLEGGLFPLVTLSTGRSLIVDLENGLGPEEKRVIEETWEGYRVVTSPRDGNFLDLLKVLLAESAFHSVTAGRPLLIGRSGEVRLTADFVILKGPESLLEGNLYLVSVADPSSSLPPQIRAMAGDHRIKVVEIFPAGGTVSPSPRPSEEYWHPTMKYTSSDTLLLLREIAPLLGLEVLEEVAPVEDSLPWRRSLALRWRQRKGTVGIERGTGKICVDGGGGAIECSAPSTPIVVLLARLLAEFGFPFFGPGVELYSPGERFTVTVPGIYLAGAAGPVLITGDAMSGPVASLLAESGVKILTLIVRAGGE